MCEDVGIDSGRPVMDSAILLSRNGAFFFQARNYIEAIARFHWSLLVALHLEVYMQHCEPDATNTEKTLGKPRIGFRRQIRLFLPYGKIENSPCMESKRRTCRTNH